MSGGRTNQGNGETGLFEKLDANGDLRLGPDELALTPRMRKFDLDDDRTISPAELTPSLSGPFTVVRQDGPRPNSSNDSPFLRVDSRRSHTRVARQALELYDRLGDEDNKLSSREFDIPLGQFRKCDADQDGQLDFDELCQLFRRPTPDLVLTIRLGTKDQDGLLVEASLPDDSPYKESLRISDDDVTLVVGKTQIEIGPRVTNARFRVRRVNNYEQQFQAADTDGNGYSDRQEARRYPPFRSSYQAIDQNGDDKVFKEELLAYIEQTSAAAKSRIHLNVTDQGNKLFGILDTNRDGRLNHRELIAGRQRIREWDEDGDGEIAKSEIPRAWRLSVSRGDASGGLLGFTAVAAFANPATQRPRRRPTAGPRWFQKMDRNDDGELTRQEFVGPLAQFRTIDTNSDGVIVASEAGEVK